MERMEASNMREMEPETAAPTLHDLCLGPQTRQ